MASDLKFCLETFFSGSSGIAVLGVGSEDRGDDGVGIRVASLVETVIGSCRWVRVFCGHTAPENLTGGIKEFGPSHLLVVDAARLGTEPGDIAFLPEDRIGGAPFATHTLPLAVMFSYLKETLPELKIAAIGIEPEDTAFGKPMSVPVKLAAVAVFAAIARAILGLETNPGSGRN